MNSRRTHFARALPWIVVLFAVPAVHAAFVPQYNSTGVAAFGSNTVYDYTFYFTPSYTGETLTAGDFITLYDVGPIASATVGGVFFVNTQATGVTAPSTTPTDSAAIINVTYTYEGATLTTATSFDATLSVSNLTTVAHAGQFTSTDTTAAGKIGQIGPLTLPTPTPEPAALATLALGCVGLLRRRRA